MDTVEGLYISVTVHWYTIVIFITLLHPDTLHCLWDFFSFLTCVHLRIQFEPLPLLSSMVVIQGCLRLDM